MGERNFTVARVEQYAKANIGKSERHIERKNESYENMNVDLSRAPLNVHFKSCGDLTYNAHLDKLVENGTVSLRGLKKDAKVFDEMVFDVNSAYFEERGGYEFAQRFYEQVYRFAEKEYGPENIVSAVMHADELNAALSDQVGHPVYHYHLHVVALPVVDKEIRFSKRCKDPALVGTVKEVIHQISHSKKWASQKVTDENGHTQIIKSYSLLQDRFFEYMRDAGFTDFERGERGSTAEHLSVLEYKTQKETERLSQIQEAADFALAETDRLNEKLADTQKQTKKAQAQLDAVAPKLKNAEDLARKYSDDADMVLPEAGTLETAKTYREKKAKPLFTKIIKVLRGLYHEYLDLKERFNRLTRNYQRLQDKNATLEDAFERVARENDILKGVNENYNVLCRCYGEDTIAAKVKAAKEREAAEKRQRQLSRQHKRHVSMEL